MNQTNQNISTLDSHTSAFSTNSDQNAEKAVKSLINLFFKVTVGMAYDRSQRNHKKFNSNKDFYDYYLDSINNERFNAGIVSALAETLGDGTIRYWEMFKTATNEEREDKTQRKLINHFLGLYLNKK